jgi:hypothetical protein
MCYNQRFGTIINPALNEPGIMGVTMAIAIDYHGMFCALEVAAQQRTRGGKKGRRQLFYSKSKMH